MIELEVIVDYNVILTHFVDTLSCWDYHVEKYVLDYVEKEYGITKKDEVLLKTFVKIRKPLGWKNETALFEWANDGYPNNQKFDKLLPIIKHFESIKDARMVSIKQLLLEKTNLIKANGYENISEAFSTQYGNFIEILSKLFDSKSVSELLKCYLAYSPDNNSSMGGANGDGIYIELRDSEIEGKRMLDDVVLHEYLHKRISPSTYFENNVEKISSHQYLKIDVIGYRSDFMNIIEESIVYALCDIVRENKITPVEKIKRFEAKGRNDMVALWVMVNDIMPILTEYVKNGANIVTTRQKLTEYFLTRLDEVLGAK